MAKEEQITSIQKYAQRYKLSTFAVIKKMNKGELKSIKKDGQDFIIDENIQAQTTPDIKQSSMRRAEFSVEDKTAMLEILNSCEYGTLSLSDGDTPYGVPLNFAWLDESIVFHGSLEGKKMELITQNPKASFSVVKPFSFIPSYFSGTTSACPATQFFASITFDGEVEIINDLDKKALALNALMQKMQPEKKYEDIEATNPIYKKMLEKTAVFALHVKSSSIKIKAGQNLTCEKKDSLIKQLSERAEKVDLATIELIKKFS